VTTKRVKEILSWYSADNAGTKANLARMLSHGRLAGTGKMVILPVDQGFEHGPARSFAPNPAGDIPLILKLNNSDTLAKTGDPISALTGTVDDALRLGCAAIGFTIYPGSGEAKHAYEQIRDLAEEAKAKGLAVVVWSYPRGGGMSKDGETAIDVVGYAAQIAAQLGAHVIKVKPPTAFIEQAEAKKVYEKEKIPIKTLAERARHVVQCAFAGRRIVIFSGGAAKGKAEILEEIRGLADGGSFGSIVGRNSFQRPRTEAIELLHEIMDVYASA